MKADGWRLLLSTWIHWIISNQLLAWKILLVFLCQPVLPLPIPINLGQGCAKILRLSGVGEKKIKIGEFTNLKFSDMGLVLNLTHWSYFLLGNSMLVFLACIFQNFWENDRCVSRRNVYQEGRWSIQSNSHTEMKPCSLFLWPSFESYQ